LRGVRATHFSALLKKLSLESGASEVQLKCKDVAVCSHLQTFMQLNPECGCMVEMDVKSVGLTAVGFERQGAVRANRNCWIAKTTKRGALKEKENPSQQLLPH
jgi:hypothetical protein